MSFSILHPLVLLRRGVRGQLAGQLATVNPPLLYALKSSRSLHTGAKILAVLVNYASWNLDSSFCAEHDSALYLWCEGKAKWEHKRGPNDFLWKYCFRDQNVTDWVEEQEWKPWGEERIDKWSSLAPLRWVVWVIVIAWGSLQQFLSPRCWPRGFRIATIRARKGTQIFMLWKLG